MPTVQTKSVGTASRTYSTWPTAFAALPSSIVTTNEQWIFEGYNDSQFNSAAVSLGGVTTDTTRNIICRPHAGQGWRDNASGSTPLALDQTKGVLLALNASITDFFSIANDNVLIDGLQFDSTFGTAVSINHTSGANVVIQNCLAIGQSTTSAIATVLVTGAKVDNVLSINTNTGNGFLDFGNSEFHNCGAYAPSGNGLKGFRGNYTNPLYLNCSSFGFASAPFANTGNASNDYNVSDQSSPGAHSVSFASFSAAVVSTTSDFSPKAGGPLVNAGTPDATNTGGVDIRGQTRSASTPTVGPKEFISSGPAFIAGKPSRHLQAVKRASFY